VNERPAPTLSPNPWPQPLLGAAGWLFIAWQVCCYATLHEDGSWAVLGGATVGAAFLLTVLTHELGHVAGTWLGGHTLVRFQMFSLSLERDEEGAPWRLRSSCNATLASVKTLPRDTVNLRRGLALVVAGGPAAGFVAGLAALVLAQILQPVPPLFRGGRLSSWAAVSLMAPATWPVLALGNLAVLNLMFSITNLIPSVENGFLSDGGQLLRLRHPDSEVDVAVSTLGIIMMAGTRPRDWPPQFVALLDRPAHGEKTMTHLYTYYRAVDSGDVERAGHALDLAVMSQETHPIAIPSGVFVEAAYFAAFHRGRADDGRGWLGRVTAGEVEEHTLLRAAAAVLFAGGDFAGAAKKARAGIEAAARSRDAGGAKAERDWLLGILAASLKRLAAPEEARS
jgi:hypothetical protein